MLTNISSTIVVTSSDNLSQQQPSGTPNTPLPLTITFPLALFSTFICAENIFICAIVFRHRHLQTHTNGFLVSLAVSDILLGGVFIPVYIQNPWHEMNGYLTGVILISNTFNITAVSLERFVALTQPLRHRFFIARNFNKMLSAAWIIPVAITLLPLLWDAKRTLSVHKIYLGSLIVFAVIIPYTLTFIGYTLTIRRLRKRRQNSFILSAYSRNRLHYDERKFVVGDMRVVRMCATMATLFAVSWLPIVYMSICDICDRLDLVTFYISVISIFTLAGNSIANPLLYTFMKDDFRKTIKKYYCKSLRRQRSLESTCSTPRTSTSTTKESNIGDPTYGATSVIPVFTQESAV